MSIQKEYQWLAKEPGPRMLTEALRLYGVEETQGPGNTAEIMSWAKEIGPGVQKIYSGDSIPWCGLFMSVVAKRSGKALPSSPLWARSWATWGKPSTKASLGDVLVFVREGGGHVGMYVGEDTTHYHVLGGNQHDSVRIARIDKSRCIAHRQMYSQIPANVRPIRLKPLGLPSTNEA